MIGHSFLENSKNLDFDPGFNHNKTNLIWPSFEVKKFIEFESEPYREIFKISDLNSCETKNMLQQASYICLFRIKEKK